MFVFNGDFVDRGDHQLETIGLLLALKVLLPERVWLVRGNHEDRGMNMKYGFSNECTYRLGMDMGPKVFELMHKAFEQMPLACRIDDRILVVHGGIGDGAWNINDLRAVKRPLRDNQLFASKNTWIFNILWSDPIEDDLDGEGAFGVHESPRGRFSSQFGWNVTKMFCARNGLSLVVRSHQCKQGSPGYDVMHENQLIRVFSARDYEGHGNDGAVLLVTRSAEGCLRVRPQVLRSLAKSREEELRRKQGSSDSIEELRRKKGSSDSIASFAASAVQARKSKRWSDAKQS